MDQRGRKGIRAEEKGSKRKEMDQSERKGKKPVF